MRKHVAAPEIMKLACNTFKSRLSSHNSSYKNEDANQTTLSNHIRSFTEKNINHIITWEILDRVQPFLPVFGVFSLYTKKKNHIRSKPNQNKQVKCLIIAGIRKVSYWPKSRPRLSASLVIYSLMIVHLQMSMKLWVRNDRNV